MGRRAGGGGKRGRDGGEGGFCEIIGANVGFARRWIGRSRNSMLGCLRLHRGDGVWFGEERRKM